MVSRTTVYEYQRALKYSKGRFIAVLRPGQHWTFRPTSSLMLVDVRPSFVQVNGQDVLSSDGVSLKASLAAKYEMVDPNRAINEVQDWISALYLSLQMALRTIVGAATIEELLEKRDVFGPRLLELVSPQAEEIGLRLISADLRDIMLSGDAKKAFALVVKAKLEGQAALEKARGETAAMRNLANAARMMEEHPALLQLRALQQMGDGPGHTLVLNLSPDTQLLPTKGEPGKRPGSDKESDV